MKVVQVGYSHKGTNARLLSLFSKQQNLLGIESSVFTYYDNGVNGDFLYAKKGFARTFKLAYNSFDFISRLVRLNANIYHFHEPFLLPIAICLRIYGKIVFYDVHEDYSRWRFSRFPAISFLFKLMEKRLSCLVNCVTAATELVSKRYPNCKLVVHNFLPSSLVPICKPKPLIQSCDPIKVVYHGSLSFDRGLDTIIKATFYCKYPVELYIIGRWTTGLLQKCSKLQGWSNVIKINFMPHDEVLSFISTCDLGLQVVKDVPSLQGGYPMKVIEFQACYVPVILTNQPSKVATFKDSVIFIDPDDPLLLAETIDKLHINNSLRLDYAVRGFKYFNAHFDSSYEAQELNQLYRFFSK